MTRTIAINGIRLDRVRMPLPPQSKNVISSLCYPMNQLRLSQDDRTLRLVLPAYLSVELYRTGILPQDPYASVRVSIGGRPVGRYTVSDVRYPLYDTSPFGEVTFTLTRVPRKSVRAAFVQTPPEPAKALRSTWNELKRDEQAD